MRLEIAENHRDLALFNLALDSKLRGCDLVKLKVADVYAAGKAKERASIIQSKTQKPVRFEITEGTRKSLLCWMDEPLMIGLEYLWPGRFHERLHISTRQYARLVRDWVKSIGLEPSAYGTHSMRRTKVAQIYRKTGNLRAVQPLLGNTKMDSTVRYLGVELGDALGSQRRRKSEGFGRLRGRPLVDIRSRRSDSQKPTFTQAPAILMFGRQTCGAFQNHLDDLGILMWVAQHYHQGNGECQQPLA